VGFLESDGNAYESEIWADRHDLMRDRMREDFTHVVAKVEASDLDAARAAMNAWEADPRLGVTVYNEYLYYRYLSRAARRIRTACLGMLAAMVVAAVLGGFNTLHASLVTRLREMGLLAALGFRRREILLAFLTESQVIALLGGLAGIVAALTLHGMSMNYAGTNVSFRVGPDLLLQGLGLALLIGLLGGWLPARAAARRTTAESLRAA
jgi:putative ABC transport system permease protein